MKTNYNNKTGFEIEIDINGDNVTVPVDGDITLEEELSPKEIIVYNGGDCDVFISNGYTTNNGMKIVEIYIN